MPSKTHVNVLVTVDDSRREELESVARHLAQAGMRVTNRFELGGVIAGDVAERNLSRLRSVEGVVDVSKDDKFTAL